MKITIIGLPGSGKTTLAGAISKKKNIPHINIDRFWLEGGGGHNSKTTPDPEKTYHYVTEKVLHSIQQASWVSDGFYPGIQTEISRQADEVIFLDIPLYKRLWNHFKRTFSFRTRNDGMTFFNNIEFFVEMFGPGSTRSSNIKDFLEPYKDKTKILRSEREIADYVSKV